MTGLLSAIELPIDEIAGLPLHPLIVHAVVVMVPLASLGVIVMGTSGARSKRYSPMVVFVAFVAMVSAFGARLSGEQLRDELGMRGAQHFQYGAYLPWVAVALFACCSILALMDRQGGGRRNGVGTLFALVSMLVAVGATVFTVLTGHSGSELVWG